MSSYRLPVIFVVDNNQLFRRLTVRYLNVADFCKILTFPDAGECLRFIDLHPDIVVTDLYYGESQINGVDLLIKAKSLSPKTRFIFLSSTADIETAIRTIHLGAVDFIVKSKTALNKLLIRIKQLIDFDREIKKANTVYIKLALSVAALIITFICLIFLYVR